jgi:hypothetical protein
LNYTRKEVDGGSFGMEGEYMLRNAM